MMQISLTADVDGRLKMGQQVLRENATVFQPHGSAGVIVIRGGSGRGRGVGGGSVRIVRMLMGTRQ